MVWYTAYGSNMHATRLGAYLAGGTPPGSLRSYAGCRDHRPPRATAPVMLPGGIYFALESKAWTGGMAFYDHELTGEAAARAYLISAGQFADIAAQEMHRPTGVDISLENVIAKGRVAIGGGRYETLVFTGRLHGLPLVTFTAPWRAGDVPFNAPSVRYLEMLASGLYEAHSWSAARIARYLVGRPGMAGTWRESEVRDIAQRGINLGPVVAALESDLG